MSLDGHNDFGEYYLLPTGNFELNATESSSTSTETLEEQELMAETDDSQSLASSSAPTPSSWSPHYHQLGRLQFQSHSRVLGPSNSLEQPLEPTSIQRLEVSPALRSFVPDYSSSTPIWPFPLTSSAQQMFLSSSTGHYTPATAPAGDNLVQDALVAADDGVYGGDQAVSAPPGYDTHTTGPDTTYGAQLQQVLTPDDPIPPRHGSYESDSDGPRPRGAKQRRLNVKNSSMQLVNSFPGVVENDAVPSIHGRPNDSRFVHSTSIATGGTHVAFVLQTILPPATNLRLSYEVVPKNARTSEDDHLLSWHNLRCLRSYTAPLILPNNRRRQRGADAKTKLQRVDYEIQIPGSAASIAYLKLEYTYNEQNYVLHTRPFVSYTQLRQREKGLGYLLQLAVELNLTDHNAPINVASYVQAFDHVLTLGTQLTRHFTLADLNTCLGTSLADADFITYAQFKTATQGFLSLIYALRCKSRYQDIKQGWNQGVPINALVERTRAPAAHGAK